MYMTPSKGTGGTGNVNSGGGGSGTPRKQQIPEGPISIFTALIYDTPSDQWQKRVAAFRKLIDSIPEGSKYSATTAWYNTPPLLRHLAVAIGDLLKDPRSTVVKRTCESLTRLFIKCQSDARYLFKDLMTVILSVHAQTVQVIRNAVQEMVLDSIPEVPCKMVMPLWMERLKVDKSRTVRDACALYLGQALRCWNGIAAADNNNSAYLTEEIWIQVGGTLMRSLRDPSPTVRAHAKSALEFMQKTQPMCWTQLVTDEESPVAKDPKLLRWLQSLGQQEGYCDTEELSVASKFSYNSDSRYARQPTRMSSSPAARSIGGGRRGFEQEDVDLDIALNIPLSINVKSSSNMNMNGGGGFGSTSFHRQHRPALGPPIRVSAPFQQIMESPPPTINTNKEQQYQQQQLYQKHQQSAISSSQAAAAGTGATGTPPRPPQSSSPAAAGITATGTPASTNSDEKHKSPSSFLHTIEDKEQSDHSQHDHPEQRKQHQEQQFQQPLELESDSSFPSEINSFKQQQQQQKQLLRQQQEQQLQQLQSNNNGKSHHHDPAAVANTPSSTDENNPFIASMQELKKHAAQRRSRNSILMLERFRMSSNSNNTSSASLSNLVVGGGSLDDRFGDGADGDDGGAEKTASYDGDNSYDTDVAAAAPSAAPATTATAPPPRAQAVAAVPPPQVASRSTSSSSAAAGVGSTPSILSAPEHMVIAIRLLRAHKGHVDQIMETLKIEMDTLRDFDRLLEEPGRPLEEEVLDYFESVGLCLDQRTQAGLTLQKEMDRISRGEPPQE